MEEALERQWAEIEWLTAIFEGDEDIALEFSNSEQLEETRKDEEHKEVILLVRFRNRHRHIPCVRIKLPKTYPCEALPEVELTNYFLGKCHGELEELLEVSAGEECLFQIIQLLRDALLGVGGAGENESSSDEGEFEREEAILPLDEAEGGGRKEGKGAPLVLGRRLCFSHHIIAPGKRSAVINWAVQLQLGGCSKIGWYDRHFLCMRVCVCVYICIASNLPCLSFLLFSLLCCVVLCCVVCFTLCKPGPV